MPSSDRTISRNAPISRHIDLASEKYDHVPFRFWAPQGDLINAGDPHQRQDHHKTIDQRHQGTGPGHGREIMVVEAL